MGVVFCCYLRGNFSQKNPKEEVNIMSVSLLSPSEIRHSGLLSAEELEERRSRQEAYTQRLRTFYGGIFVPAKQQQQQQHVTS